jgi:wyosine [tRNA(Phe)-imidazoG37] synthetase (radical SAM superfamily)
MQEDTKCLTLNAKNYPNLIFGPIISRRFGKSLGVDLSPSKKQCNFDCLYCELASVDTTCIQDEIISVDDVISQIKEALKVHQDIDVLTITANGEPTLYPYLNKLIDSINEIKGDIKTLILSNGSTIYDNNVQQALYKFDEVKLSLDCASARCMKKLDRNHNSIDIEDIKRGMLEFKQNYNGILVIEVLFVKGINDKADEIQALDEFLSILKPNRIDISTIDRPPAYDVKALTYQELYDISLSFSKDLNIYIAHRKKQDIKPSSYNEDEIINTLEKRPLSDDDVDALFDKDSKKLLLDMQKNGKIKKIQLNGINFYKKA